MVGPTRPALRVRSVEEHDDEWRVSFKANGACLPLRRATIEGLRARFGVGPFDPVFDPYGEDVDFSSKTWSLHPRDERGRLRVNPIAER